MNKIIAITVIIFLLLAASFIFLISTCMWGCPNTGIQLLFKISTLILAIVLCYCFFRIWKQYKANSNRD